MGLECDYISEFFDLSQKHVLCKDFVFFRLFISSDAYVEAMRRGLTFQLPHRTPVQAFSHQGFGQATLSVEAKHSFPHIALNNWLQ